MKAPAAASTRTQKEKPARPEGALPRERLLQAALVLFAEQGYAKTSVRQIALAAQMNIAAVSYYFGDKAGLYKSVYCGMHHEPGLETTPADLTICDETVSLEEFYARFLQPLKSGADVRLWMMLHRREMLEPSGLWTAKVESGIRPMHTALTSMLCMRLGLAKPDDDVLRLAISIAALAVHLYMGREAIDALAPQLTKDAEAFDLWGERLVEYAEAMIAAECQRRKKTNESTTRRVRR